MVSVALTLVGLRGLIAARVLCEPTPEARRYAELFHPTRSHDGVVIGSSHTAWGLSPRPLSVAGLPFYNFSMPGASLRYYEAFYSLYRRYNPAPRHVILAADWFMFTSYCAKTVDEDLGYMPWGEIWRVCRNAGPRDLFGLRNVLQLKRDASLVQRRIGLYQYPTTVLDEAYFDGFTPVTARRLSNRRMPVALTSDLSRTSELRRLLTRLAAEHARVVLVQTPEYLPIAGHHGRENAAIAEVACAAGVPFLDYNDTLASSLNRDSNAYVDFEHLNLRGADRFSRRLAADLRTIWGD